MYRIGQEEIDAVARAINSKDFFKINGSGQEVLHFENEWKSFVGSDYALLMTSGYAAIVSALIGIGAGPGDEVIVPAYTYIATALAVLETGAIPVIADADETLTIDVEDVKRKITKNTKAIIPVHIQGFPSDMDGLKNAVKGTNIKIVEDACQSAGGMYKGRLLGSIGDAGTYSFNYFKIITAGEGGAVVTNDRKIYERALIYHDAGAVAFFGDQLNGISEELFGGREYRVSDITGAILREQLKKLPYIRADLKKNQKLLLSLLTPKYTQAPSHDFEGDLGTTVALRFGSEKETRSFAERCAANGIGVTIPFDTGKHVYTNWTQIMEKRGALNPSMDPYKFPVNKDLQMDYTHDMCKKTLELLSRTAYILVNPDWPEETVKDIAARVLDI
ncbi:MAG: aminotransferase class I/II-fold pyridoxal phosphate-dependent enzyme [Clostridia bacterium]|nr:aminotransferase class I/II-fold pyridoxal phosphate-dependent enzyme [Clostridia bacterium]